jgi:DNA-binding NarL/FixJ family response regulator
LVWLRRGDAEEAQAALHEAWDIFEEFQYGWRSALCALRLAEVTGDNEWLQRAAKKIAPWPRSWIARDVARAVAPPAVSLEKIPPARRRVLDLLCAGRRNSEIAKTLGRSPHTIRNQVAELFRTFNVSTRAELVAVLSQAAATSEPR